MSRPSTAAIESVHPLSPLQRGMLFQGVYTKGNRDYQEQVVFRVQGTLNADALAQAFQAAIDRHPSLRAAFVWQSEKEQVEVVFKAHAARLPFVHEDWSRLGESAQLGALKALLAKDHAQGYNLKRPPLARLYLLKLNEEEHYCVFCHHHLILDGWSMAIVLREVLEHYQSSGQVQRQAVEASWRALRAERAAVDPQREARAWQAKIGSAPVSSALPLRPAKEGQRPDARELRLALSPEQRQCWEQGCRRLRITSSTLMQAAYALVLGRATGSTRVGLGVTLSGRSPTVPEVGQMVGMLINTLPLVVDLDPQQSSHDYLAQVAQSNLWLQEHQYASLSDVQKWLGQAPLFETVVVYDNYPVQSLLDESERAAQGSQLRTRSLTQAEHEALGPQAAQRNHYPLTLVAVPTEDRFWLGVAYDAQRCETQTMQALLRCVAQTGCALLGEAVALGQLPWQGPAPISRVPFRVPSLKDWSLADPERASTPALVELEARGRVELSWAELEAAVGRVRTHLLQAGLALEDRVALELERSADWIICFLGILSAGGCAVPIDPQSPAGRRRAILHNCGAKLVIRDSAQPQADHSVWTAQALQQETLGGVLPTPAGLCAQHLAYLLYTSGSTGTPKGVGVSHANWAAYAAGLRTALELEGPTRAAWISGPAVDLGHSSLLAALETQGALIVVGPELAGDPDALSAALRASEVDLLKLAPTHLAALLDASSDPAGLLPKRVWLSGGEVLPAELVARVHALAPGCEIVNHYGPTESTVGVAAQRDCRCDAPLVIGQAMPHARLTIRDAWGNPVPDHFSGELWIAGDSVARGYFGDPRKTAQCFVPDPDAPSPGARAYRSGDRVRRVAEGIRFEGRIDHQLKIRGYRVEPGEIESWLRDTAKVRAAVVFAEPQDQDSLGSARELWAAIERGPQSPGVEQIAALANQALPRHMVPSKWLLHESMPQLASGKVDRKKVVALAQAGSGEQKKESVQAQASASDDPKLRQLLEIWSAVLKQEIQDPNLNFFALGGDSILSLQVVARARKAGIALLPKHIFDNPTVAQLAAALAQESAPKANETASESANSATRLRMPCEYWLDEQAIEDPSVYYQSIFLALDALPERAAFERAIAQLAERHERLGGRIIQPCWIAIDAWGEAAGRDAISRIAQQRQAKLGRDQAADLQWICFVPGRSSSQSSKEPAAWLACLAHHRAVDAHAWRVLLGELNSLIRGERLALLAVDANTWARRLHEKTHRGGFEAEREFWKAQHRPGARTRPGSLDSEYQQRLLTLGSEQSAILREGVYGRYRAGVLEALLLAWSRSQRALGRLESVVELEGHGRGWDPDLDGSAVVAWCTARYPIYLPEVPLDIEEGFEVILERRAQVPGDGSGYGALRYLCEAQKALPRAPVIDVTFNYLGQLDRDLSLHVEAGTDAHRRPELGRQRCEGYRPLSPLRITGAMRNEVLALRLDYDPQRIRSEEIEDLVRLMKSSLEQICEDLAQGPQLRWHPRDLGLPAGVATGSIDEVAQRAQDSGLGKVQEIYRAGPAQVLLWLQDQILRDREDRAYWNQFVVAWQGQSAEGIEAAFRSMMQDYPILRTVFCSHGQDGLLQLVIESPELPCQWVSVPAGSVEQERRAFSAHAAKAQGERAAVADSYRLAWHLLLAKGGDGRVWMAWTRHHILLDGWSSARLLRAFVARLQGAPAPAPGRSYRDYVEWVYQQPTQSGREFWNAQLAAASPMPDRLGPPQGVLDCTELTRPTCGITLAAQLVEGLMRQGAQLSLSLNLWCQAAWARVLSMYSDRDQVCFGIVDSGRDPNFAQSETVVGLLLQTLPLALDLAPHRSRREQLTALRDLNLKMRRHGSRGLDAGHGRLWNSLLVFENYPLERELGSQMGELLLVERHEQTHYPLTLSIDAHAQRGQALKVSLRYDARRYSSNFAQALLEAFESVLWAFAGESLANPWCGLASATPGACMAQRSSPQADSQNLIERIRRVGIERADAVALRQCDGAQLSYRELLERVRCVAAGLRAQGVGPEQAVGICIPRKIDLLVATLGVLAAGAYYVPIDPELPEQRHKEICERAAVVGVVVQGLARGVQDFCQWPLAEMSQAGAGAPWPPAVDSSYLAYQIFTSGSTGVPKGVGVEHRQVLRLVDQLCAELKLDSDDRWTLFHRHAFDVSVWEIFGALCTGASLLLIDEELQRDPKAYAACLRDHQITVASETPSAFYMMQAEILRDPSLTPQALRTVMFAGEALDTERLQAWPQASPKLRFWDLYGNTESTVHATLSQVGAQPHSIGRALGDLRIDLIDSSGDEQPPFAVGEIWIAGAGVSRGYLGDARQTAWRFVPDPKGEAGSRCYRTGDRAWKNREGDLYYAGRADRQVQLRGFRVELAEVESRLREAVQGQRVAVLKRGQGESARLVAFVEDPSQALELEQIERWARSELADYMRPARILLLPRFEMNANGKLDRAWLSEQLREASPSEAPSLPENPQLAQLNQLWEECLERRDLATFELSRSFFSLGGHSLLAVSMLNQFYCLFGRRVELAEFLKEPTRAALLRGLRGLEPNPEKQPEVEELSALLDEIEEESS